MGNLGLPERWRILVAVSTFMFVLLAGATMVSAHGGDSSIIHACVQQSSELVRIVGANDVCRIDETAVDWTIVGPQGAQGPQGGTGPQGPQGPSGPPGPAFPIMCPPDSVLVGSTCIDKYEASVWSTTDPTVIQKIKDGTVTLADLTAAAAVQLGLAASDLADAGCPPTGNGCTSVFAVSIPGVQPAAFITWFEATAVARNAAKRLPTNAEWQAAALGTPDPGTDNGTTDCNVFTRTIAATGSRSTCVSDVGAFDMVGNLQEWVADWVPLSTGCIPALFIETLDSNCLAGASSTSGPGALSRGGFFLDGPLAGVFAVIGSGNPSRAFVGLGFRAAR